MKLLDLFKGKIKIVEKIVTKEVEKKEQEPLKFVAPIFKEIPPKMDLDKVLDEGVANWAYMAMAAIADEIMSLPLKLYKKNGEEIEKDAVLNLIEKPNELQGKEEFLWQMVMCLLGTGEAPILTSGKNPKQMILLNPNRLKFNFVDGVVQSYTYTQTKGEVTEIEDPADLIFIKLPSIKKLSPFRGEGVLSYVFPSLDLDSFIEKYLINFFYNDATPGAVLETDKELNSNIIKRLKNQVNSLFRGVNNKHKLFIAEKGLKWREISSKISEMELTNNQKGLRDKIMGAFKVPKSIIGITEDVNRANGENEDRIFARRSVKPKALMIQRALNNQLLPLFAGTEGVELKFDNPVKEDEELQAKIDDIYVKNGVKTINEVRETLDLPPIKEKPVEPSKDPKEDPKKDPKEDDKKDDKKAVVKSNDPLKDTFRRILQAEVGGMKKVFSIEEVKTFHEDKVFNSDDIEARYNVELVKTFEKFGRDLVKQLNTKSKKDLDDFDYQSEMQKDVMAEVSVPFIEEAIIRQSGLTYAFLGIDKIFTDQDKFVVDYLATRTLKLATTTAQTTRDNVERILMAWAEDGGSVADLKKTLKDYFHDSNRASVISRTEVSRASGQATSKIYSEVKAVGKQWITAGDERVCQFCRGMDRKIIPINRNFWRKGQTMIGDEGGKLNFGFEGVKQFPLHAQCRCDLIPIFDKTLVPTKSFEFHDINDKRLAYDEGLEKREAKLLEEKEAVKKENEKLELKTKQFIEDADSLVEANEKVDEKKAELKKLEEKNKKELQILTDFKDESKN